MGRGWLLLKKKGVGVVLYSKFQPCLIYGIVCVPWLITFSQNTMFKMFEWTKKRWVLITQAVKAVDKKLKQA